MEWCLSGCTSLTQAPSIPESVTSMDWCFSGCTSLTQVQSIPQSVKSMNRCFLDCTSLTQGPIIPESVTNMDGCFYGCAKLKTITLRCPYECEPYSSFYRMFANCSSLEDGGIKVPKAELEVYKYYASAMRTSSKKFAPIE